MGVQRLRGWSGDKYVALANEEKVSEPQADIGIDTQRIRGWSGDSVQRIRGWSGDRYVALADEETASEPRARMSWSTVALVTIASIGGFLFGYDTGVVSGAMLEMKQPEAGLSPGGMSIGEQELIVSCTVGAAAIGSAISGLAQRSPHIGRKTASLVGSVLFVIGAVSLALSRSLGELTAARAIVGLAVGIASQCIPIYIAEMAPAPFRGTCSVMNNVMIVMGQVIASGVCCNLARHDLRLGTMQGWRWMLGLGAVPGLLMTVGVFFLPESPRWLMQTRNDADGALASLGWLRGSEDVARSELREITAAIEEEQEQSRQVRVTGSRLFQDLAQPRVLRALALGVGLQLLQQTVGINTIMYYSATILQMTHGTEGKGACDGGKTASGVSGALTSSDVNDVCWTMPVASCQMLGNIIGMFFADRAGRRPLTLFSLSMVSVSLVGLGYAFFPEEPIGWLALVGMCIYLLAFGIGMSPMPWLVNAEIYPLHVRSVANSLATSANWAANFIVAATFLNLAKGLSTNHDCPAKHPDGAFWLYAGIAVMGALALAWGMPETRGKSLEEIDELFEGSQCSCRKEPNTKNVG